MPKLNLIVEQQTRQLLRSFTSLEALNLPTFVHGETLDVNLYLVRRRGSATGGGKWVDQLDLTDYTARIAIGKVDEATLAGTWTWTWGADTISIPYNATAASMQTLLNGGAAMTAAGGCAVTAQGDLFLIRWNNVGARTAPSADASLLVPPSVVDLAMLDLGSASARACAVLQVMQSPAALCDLSTATGTLSTTLTVLRQGAVSPPVNHMIHVAFSQLPVDGYWNLSVVIPTAAATLATALTGADNDFVLTAVESGPDGNAITLALVDPSGNDQVLAVVVTGTDIVVNLATGPAGAITSTAQDVIDALAADTDAAALVTAALATGNAGTGVVTAMAETALSGGAEAPEISAGISPNASAADAVEILEAMTAFGAGNVAVSKLSESEWIIEWINDVGGTVPGTVAVEDEGLEIAAGLTGELSLATGAMLIQLAGAASARLTMEIAFTPLNEPMQKFLAREVIVSRGLIDPSMITSVPPSAPVSQWTTVPTAIDDWSMFDDVKPTSGRYLASDGNFLYIFNCGVSGWDYWSRVALAQNWISGT